MILYFSGVAGQSEAGMLAEAGVSALLADPTDAGNAGAHVRAGGAFALDSGAYRAHKQGTPLPPLPEYLSLAGSCGARWAVAPDVFGDPDASFRAWNRARGPAAAAGVQLVPVWAWGGYREYLYRLLDAAPLVAVGGLVPAMRAKDERMLRELGEICRAHPNRLHLLGANWLRALEELAPYAASADTSKWLDGGRYGSVIFTHTRTGRLSQAPFRVLPGCADWDRRRRCVESARAMAAHLRGG